MFYILALTLLFVLLYTIWTKEYAYFSCFALVYPIIITASLFTGGEGAKQTQTAIVFALYIMLLVIKFPPNTYSCSFYYRSPLTITFLCFILVVLLHDYFISPYFEFHTKEMVKNEASILSNIIIPYFLAPYLINNRRETHSFTNAIVLWSLFLIFEFVYVFGFNQKLFSDRMLFETISDGLLGPIALSRFAALFLVFVILKVFSKADLSSLPISIVLIGLATISLLITGQRGTIIGVIIGLSLLLLQPQWRKRILYFIPILLLLLIIVSFLKFGVFGRFEEFENIKQFERFKDYPRVYNIFDKNDFLWGLGSMGYFWETGRSYPHNIVLEHISSYGLLGLICIGMIIYYGFKMSIHIVKHSDNYHYHFYACSWVMLLFSALVSSGISQHRILYLFSGILMLIYNDMKYSTFGDTPLLEDSDE